MILFTAPTVANPSTRTMHTCTHVHMYTCTHVHMYTALHNLPTHVHVHTSRQHRISFPAENLSQFSLLTYRSPPQRCCHQQQSSQMLSTVCRASFPPCLPLGVDIGLKKVPSNPLATSGPPAPAGNQWVPNE